MAVRLQPKASAERVVGLVAEADGSAALKIAVTAPPADGKANAALVRLLARLFHLPPRDFSVVLGAADRRKVVEIAGEPGALAPIIAEGLRPWSKPGS
ncbi:MAG: DUF167 domain-containing protein [Acidobacteriota bacterium]